MCFLHLLWRLPACQLCATLRHCALRAAPRGPGTAKSCQSQHGSPQPRTLAPGMPTRTVCIKHFSVMLQIYKRLTIILLGFYY